MVALRVARAPKLVQITGQTARRAEHDIFRAREIVHRADDFSLAHRRAGRRVIKPIHFLVPLTAKPFAALAVTRAHLPAAPRFAESFECCARVGDDWKRTLFESV